MKSFLNRVVLLTLCFIIQYNVLNAMQNHKETTAYHLRNRTVKSVTKTTEDINVLTEKPINVLTRKVYSCSQCPKEFALKGHLRQHSQKSHYIPEPLEWRLKRAFEENNIIIPPTQTMSNSSINLASNSLPTEGLVFLEDPFRMALDHLAISQEKLTSHTTSTKKIREPKHIINVWS